jgi:hypothetical protein
LWPHRDTAPAAVVGDAGIVVDDDGSIVNVGDVDVDAVDRTVVVEVIPVPITTVIADTGIAEAVVNTTVEADVQAPEATMEAVTPSVEAPVARSPERAVVGRSAPCARDPVVAGRSPAPVARSPQIIGRGCNGLLVDGQRRRRFVGVFDWRALAVGVELVIGLSVLIGLILIWQRRGLLSGLLGSILLRILLGLGLRADSKDLSLGGGSDWLRLAVVDWRHVGVRGVGA